MSVPTTDDEKPTTEIKNQVNTWKNRRRMAYISLFSTIAITAFTLTPLVSESRISALQPILSTFFFSMAGVIGAYVGFATMADKWGKK